jgi:hypothetical protein
MTVEPEPLMVMVLRMSRSPVAAASSPAPAMVRLYVPAGKVIVSAPLPAEQESTLPSVLAAMIASRSEQRPLIEVSSAVVVTAMMVAAASAVGWFGKAISKKRKAARRVTARSIGENRRLVFIARCSFFLTGFIEK